MIEARDIHKRLGAVELFGGVSLGLGESETLALLGPSGAGKTTLLRILAGLADPDAGEIRWGGVPLAGLGDRARSRLRATRMGFVFQGDNLLPHLTVLQNVLLPGALGGQAISLAGARSALARVGLESKGGQRAATVSGGEAQRIALARAVAQRPAALLCDEPTGSLDAASAERIGELLLEAARELRCAVVVATHDLALAARCGRRLTLGGGA